MEDDIQNYLPSVMFSGTPCIIAEDFENLLFIFVDFL